MTRPKKIISFAALALVAFIAALVLYATSGPPEPEYHGKKLSYWYRHGMTASGYSSEATDAFRAIGTNGFPFLFHEFTAKDPVDRFLLRHRASYLLFRLGLRSDFMLMEPERTVFAGKALATLGPDATPLLPDLIPLLGHDLRAVMAVDIIRGTGTNAIPTLTTALSHHDPYVRLTAAAMLYALTTNTATFSPILISSLRDRSSPASRYAAHGLLFQHQDIVPTLDLILECARDPDEAFATQAINSFGNLNLDTNTVAAALPFLRSVAQQTVTNQMVLAARETLALLAQRAAALNAPTPP